MVLATVPRGDGKQLAATLFEAARIWSGVKEPLADALTETLAMSVIDLVESSPASPVIRNAAGDVTEWRWPAIQGAAMLIARLLRRRNSPGGIEPQFDAAGVAYVARTDPDISRLLRLGPHTPPMIG